jgi:hypothetical protein
MAQLTIHNLTDQPVYLGDLYTSVPVHEPLVVNRPSPGIKHLGSLKRALDAEQVALGISYGVGEIAPADPFSGAEESLAARKTWEVR